MPIDDSGITKYADGEPITQSVLNRPIENLLQKLGTVSLKNILESSDIGGGEIKKANMGINSVGKNQIENGQIENQHIQIDQIDTVNITNDQVKTNKIEDGQITLLKMQNNSVNTNNLVDGQVKDDKLADGGIELKKLKYLDASNEVKILGRLSGIGEIQQLSFDDIFLEELGNQAFKDHGESEFILQDDPENTTGDDIETNVMSVGQFNIGVKKTYNTKVLMFKDEADFDIWEGSTTPLPDYVYDYGDILDLQSGFYALGTEHEQNPLYVTPGNPLNEEGTLIITPHRDQYMSFLFQSMGTSSTEPRMFIQNQISFNTVGWVEMCKKSELTQAEGRITSLETDLGIQEGKITVLETFETNIDSIIDDRLTHHGLI